MSKKNKVFLIYCIIGFTVLSMCLACSSKYSKKNHIVTFILTDSFYVEKYKVFSGGTTTSDSYSYYITDSIHFRKYVGTEYYSDEQIFWAIKDSDQVVFYLAFSKLEKKKTKERIVNDTTKIVSCYIQMK